MKERSETQNHIIKEQVDVDHSWIVLSLIMYHVIMPCGVKRECVCVCVCVCLCVYMQHGNDELMCAMMNGYCPRMVPTYSTYLCIFSKVSSTQISSVVIKHW